MIQELEILITEDSEKHLTDARSVSEQYVNINFAFARTLQEAESLIEQNRYDAVVTDVFFPLQEGGEPTSESGLNLARKLDEQGIPFVYNTAGNHHGREYKQFLEESRKFWNESGFGNGKLIETYRYSEECSKQWNAAINYAILLGKSQDLDDEVKKAIGKMVNFPSYGDYGKLSETFRLLLDESFSLEGLSPRELERFRIYGEGISNSHKDALHFVRSTLAEYRK